MLKNMWWLWLVLAAILVWKNWESVKKMLGMGSSTGSTTVTAKTEDYTDVTDI